MALTGGLGAGFQAPTIDSYVSLADLLDGDLGQPDNRAALIKTFGDQGITGFLKMVGATKAQAVQDSVQYWEEGRLHSQVTFSGVDTLAANQPLRANDVLLIGEDRVWFDGTDFYDVTDGTAAYTGIAAGSYPIVGNLYAQGTDQGSAYLESGVQKRENAFMIMKENYKVTGSQATNIGWVD